MVKTLVNAIASVGPVSTLCRLARDLRRSLHLGILHLGILHLGFLHMSRLRLGFRRMSADGALLGKGRHS